MLGFFVDSYHFSETIKNINITILNGCCIANENNFQVTFSKFYEKKDADKLSCTNQISSSSSNGLPFEHLAHEEFSRPQSVAQGHM
jgi:hypothetical protein